MLHTLFFTTTGWTVIACLLGITCPAFKWTDRPIVQTSGQGSDVVIRQQQFGKATGFQAGAPGVLTAVVFGLIFLFVVATSPLAPAPWWRSMTVAVLAIGEIIILLVTGRDLWLGFPTGDHHIGGLIAYLCAFFVLVMVSLEFRGSIKWHQAARRPE